MSENVIEEVATVAEEVIKETEEIVENVSKKNIFLRIIAFPFTKIALPIGKFGIKRLKIFGSKFRRFTNFATDDEKGPVIRFSAWLFFRIGALLGITGGLVLQHNVDVVQFVINLFN